MADFYFEFAKRSIANGQGDPWKHPWGKDRCAYHDHRGQLQGYSCTLAKVYLTIIFMLKLYRPYLFIDKR